MPDIFSKAKRSELMSKVRSRGNKDTELALMNLFRLHRITGWRRNQSVFGKPDFVFRKARLAVFVDGCFWHGCPLHATFPKSNQSYWLPKLAENKERDQRQSDKLRTAGWAVIRFWEHECLLTTRKTAEAVSRRLRSKGQMHAR